MTTHSESLQKTMTDREYLRYSRQMLVPEVGEEGMGKLAKARVLIIGLGGLGQLAAQYLAAAGVGSLTLVDPDTIEISNLPRQLLYQEADIGKYKALVAKHKLTHAFANITLEALTVSATKSSLPSLLKAKDLVLDCTDNFNTRQAINFACVTQKIPLIIAAIANLSGQILMVDGPNSNESGCYHCLFPASTNQAHDCTTLGVMGPSVGVMASMQAQWALNYLLSIGEQDSKYLHLFDVKQLAWRQVNRAKDPICPVCEAKGESRDDEVTK